MPTFIWLEPTLAYRFQGLANQHIHSLHHRDWFREVLVTQDKPMRLGSVPFAVVVKEEMLILPAVSKL